MPQYQFAPEAIHADWPTYPAGRGVSYALESLCCFPTGTHFRRIDNIDRCSLLLALEYQRAGHSTDVFSAEHHHVALWDDDLRSLQREGYLHLPAPSGAFAHPEYSRRMPSGVIPLRCIEGESCHQDDEAWFAIGSPEGLIVSDHGWRALWQINEQPDLGTSLRARLTPLLKIGYFDSAVREAAILLEEELRRRTGTGKFGQDLVKHYVDQIVRRAGMNGAFQRHLRAELRTIFMFVRNEFAHNIISLDPARCHAMLHRIDAIVAMLDNADEGAIAFQDVILARHTDRTTE